MRRLTTFDEKRRREISNLRHDWWSRALVFPFVYAISPLTTVGDTAGYVIVFMPVLALLLTAWIRTTRQVAGVAAAVQMLMAGTALRLHHEYGDIVGRVPFPAFVIVKGLDPPSTDYEAFREARYGTREVGPFTIYYRPGLSEGVGAKG